MTMLVCIKDTCLFVKSVCFSIVTCPHWVYMKIWKESNSNFLLRYIIGWKLFSLISFYTALIELYQILIRKVLELKSQNAIIQMVKMLGNPLIHTTAPPIMAHDSLMLFWVVWHARVSPEVGQHCHLPGLGPIRATGATTVQREWDR